MIAITSDCDCLDVRDFQRYSDRFDEVGIPIDWSFFPVRLFSCDNGCNRYEERWSRRNSCQPFVYDDPYVKDLVDNRSIRTIHVSGSMAVDNEERVLEIMSGMKNPIFSFHGLVRDEQFIPIRNTANHVVDHWKFMKGKSQSLIEGIKKYSRAMSYRHFIHAEDFKRIGLFELDGIPCFRRFWHRNGSFDQLPMDIELAGGYDAVINTHIGWGNVGDIFEEVFDGVLKTLDRTGYEVVDLDRWMGDIMHV